MKEWRKPRFYLADVAVELLDDLWFQVSRLNARLANERGQQVKPKARSQRRCLGMTIRSGPIPRRLVTAQAANQLIGYRPTGSRPEYSRRYKFFKHRFTNHGRPDVSATKLQLSLAMPGCVLSLPAYAFVGGGTAPYLH